MNIPKYFYFRIKVGLASIMVEDASEVDVVEVVRCKDCRYYEWMSNRVPNEQTWFCHNWNTETGKDDFCSYAERRKG